MRQRSDFDLVGNALALLVLPTERVDVQPGPEDRRSCFCLQHEQYQITAELHRGEGAAGLLRAASCCGIHRVRLLAVSRDRRFLTQPMRGICDLDLDTFIFSGKAVVALRIRADYTSSR